MTVKLTGAQWNQFVHEPWPDDCWVDDEEIRVNEVTTPYPAGVECNDVVEIVGGEVRTWSWSATGFETPMSFEEFVRKWLKKQTQASLAVSCPKDKVKEVTAAIVAAGGKVNK